MAPRVWLANEDDADAVSELIAAFRDHRGKADPSDHLVHATVNLLLRDPNTDYLLAAPGHDSAPAAVCQLRYRLAVWTGADDCWLEDLFVDAPARRGGLGRALIDAAFEHARARGCRRISLNVEEDNANALALYREMGFENRTLHSLRAL